MTAQHTGSQEALRVLRAQAGDREALELLLAGLADPLRGYLRSVVAPADADDLLQDVLFTIYRKLAWLESPELFRPWAFRIAGRAALRHLKKQHRSHAVTGGEAIDTVPSPEPPPPAELTAGLATIEGISPASRAVLVLHFQQELSLPEVAGLLGIPLGTVKSRLAYGLAALRKLLDFQGERRHDR